MGRKMKTSIGELRARFKDLHSQKAVEVKRTTRRDKRDLYHHKADEAEDASRRGNQRELFRYSKELG